MTEQAFAAELEGVTVVAYLATLAPAEREAVRRAREAIDAPERPVPSAGERERVLPPQVIHDLAGARHETLLLLDLLDEDGLNADAGGESVRALLEAVSERETAAAALIVERGRGERP